MFIESNRLLHSSSFKLPNSLIVIYTGGIGASGVIYFEDVQDIEMLPILCTKIQISIPDGQQSCRKWFENAIVLKRVWVWGLLGKGIIKLNVARQHAHSSLRNRGRFPLNSYFDLLWCEENIKISITKG